jgi:hypothetical protein
VRQQPVHFLFQISFLLGVARSLPDFIHANVPGTGGFVQGVAETIRTHDAANAVNNYKIR